MKFNNEELYTFSSAIRFLEKEISKVQSYHIYRYSRFVDTSSKGFDCSMAIRTKAAINEDDVEFVTSMEKIAKLASSLATKYLEEIADVRREEKQPNN